MNLMRRSLAGVHLADAVHARAEEIVAHGVALRCKEAGRQDLRDPECDHDAHDGDGDQPAVDEQPGDKHADCEPDPGAARIGEEERQEEDEPQRRRADAGPGVGDRVSRGQDERDRQQEDGAQDVRVPVEEGADPLPLSARPLEPGEAQDVRRQDDLCEGENGGDRGDSDEQDDERPHVPALPGHHSRQEEERHCVHREEDPRGGDERRDAVDKGGQESDQRERADPGDRPVAEGRDEAPVTDRPDGDDHRRESQETLREEPRGELELVRDERASEIAVQDRSDHRQQQHRLRPLVSGVGQQREHRQARSGKGHCRDVREAHGEEGERHPGRAHCGRAERDPDRMAHVGDAVAHWEGGPLLVPPTYQPASGPSPPKSLSASARMSSRRGMSR